MQVSTFNIGPPRRRGLVRGLIVLAMIVAALGPATVSLAGTTLCPTCTLTTDKADYGPSEVVTIHGVGFSPPVENVPVVYDVAVQRPDGSFVVLDPTTHQPTGETHQHGTGPNFDVDYQLDGVYGTYWVRAYVAHTFNPLDPLNGVVASVSFTDGSNLDQWANAPSNAWQNGNLNPQNSTYGEASIVPFRLKITAPTHANTCTVNGQQYGDMVPGQPYTFKIEYSFSDGGHEGYDFLTTYNIDEHNAFPCQNDTGSGGRSALQCGTSTTNMPVGAVVAPFPQDSMDVYNRVIAAGGTPLTADNLNPLGAMTYAGLGALSANALTLWGVEANSVTISGPEYVPDQQLNYHAIYTIQFTPTGFEVELAWGAHVANSAYWKTTTGGPNGASLAHGSSWHMLQYNMCGASKEDKSIQLGITTAIQLVDFSAKATGGRLLLQWQTGTETNNAGFNVLRATSAAGPYVQINTQLIGATGDAAAGGSYSFLDRPGYGKFFYKLQDVNLSGAATTHDAVQVTVAWPFLRPAFQPSAPAH